MKIFSFILYLLAIFFSILKIMGHNSSWASAALCFFAATMIIIGQRSKMK